MLTAAISVLFGLAAGLAIWTIHHSVGSALPAIKEIIRARFG